MFGINKLLISTSVAAATLFGHSASGFSEASTDFSWHFDVVGKTYLAATLEGAAQGLRERGWFDIGISGRIARATAGQGREIRAAFAPVRARARNQAISGKWSEAALEGYLQALELPREKYESAIDKARVRNGEVAHSYLRATLYIEENGGRSAVDWYRQQAMMRVVEVEEIAAEISSERLHGDGVPIVSASLQMKAPDAPAAEVEKGFFTPKTAAPERAETGKSLSEILSDFSARIEGEDDLSPG